MGRLISWYGSADEDFTIQRVSTASGYNTFQTLATFDHVGASGGGDWHPMFFGDLLIYARSGSAAVDGVVVYRLQYNNFDDPAARSITPIYVGSLRAASKVTGRRSSVTAPGSMSSAPRAISSSPRTSPPLRIHSVTARSRSPPA
jgi:hypothetical protein